MDKGLKRHLFNKLYTGHHHDLVTEWIMCKHCGPHFKAWQEEKAKLKRERPELFIDKKKIDKNKRLDELIIDMTDINRELRKQHERWGK